MTQTINLGFNTIPETTLAVADDADDEAVVTAILALPAVDKALREVVSSHLFPLFDRSSDLRQDSLDQAASAFLKDGREGFEAWGQGLVNEDAHRASILTDIDEDETYDDIRSVIVCAVEAATNQDADGDDLLRGPMDEMITEVMGQQDKSTALDLIGPHDYAMICYVPAHHFGFEDDAILGRLKSLRPSDVELDTRTGSPRLPAGYLAYLSLVNAEPTSLREELDDCGLAPSTDTAIQSGHAEAWKAADWGYDPRRPSLHDAHTVRTVLENAGDCSVAMVTMRVNLRALVAHDFTRPTRISPAGRGKPRAGFINLVHGAGHDEPIGVPIEVPAGREKWHSLETNGYSYTHSAGIVTSAYEVALSTPTDEVGTQPKAA